MRRRNLPVLLLLLSGCTAAPFAPLPPAAQHAALVTAADLRIGLVVDHLAARERAEVEQAASLRFAAGGTVPRSLPPLATPVAGAVLDPGMDLVAIQARRVAALSLGTAPADQTEAAAALGRVEAALAGLRAVPARWPSEAERRRGLEGLRSLAAPVPSGMDAARLAVERQAALEAGVALLQAVMGQDGRAALRGALAQRHEAWRAAQRGVLEAARTDRNLTPADRIALWNRVQAALAGDPPDLPAAEVVAALGALPAAHAAAGAGDAAGLAGLQAATARLQGVIVQAR
ncbi:hypothetical protein [Roseomonas sp. HF4]|uniref:hypothetical protein n=1 Tax=Roseomonas sp. HF4 TaxID=2562313 RepID=UPI0010C0F11A|nr:hypothetical protein [Roseomonas sp. HF4]